ncbi:MAG: M23 family metallopeptidase [Sumerlaeia bacterium]
MNSDATIVLNAHRLYVGGKAHTPVLRALLVTPDGQAALGTHGDGLLLGRLDKDRSWHRLTKEQGLSWRNVSALAAKDDNLWVGTSGGGAALIRRWRSSEPEVYALRPFARRHRYITGVGPWGSGAFVATADGLLRLNHNGEIEEEWARETFGHEYLTALWVNEETHTVVAGNIRAGMISRDGGDSWTALWPEETQDARRNRVRHILPLPGGDGFAVATDGGLAISHDMGTSWNWPETALGPEPLRRIAFAEDGTVLAASYQGLLNCPLDGGGVVLQPREEHGPSNDIYDVAVWQGAIYLATGAGLISTAAKAPATPPRKPEIFDLEPLPLKDGWPFLAIERPVAPEDQPYPDQTYLFATTCGGEFRPHEGIDVNVIPDAPMRACAAGRIRRVRERDGNAVYLDHDQRYNGWIMTTVYVHNNKIVVREHERVEPGQIIALAGDKGRATNSHLHYEVRWRPEDVSLDKSFVTNPGLWLKPAEPNLGAVAFRYIKGQEPVRITGIAKPYPAETPFAYAESPHPSLIFDAPGSGWIVISDVPAGRHALEFRQGNRISRAAVTVEAGALRLFDLPPMG